MTQETQTFRCRGSGRWDVLGLCKEQSEGSNPALIIVGEKKQGLSQDRRAVYWKDIPVVSLLLPEQIFA